MNFEDSFVTHSIAQCSCGGHNHKLCGSCLAYLFLNKNNYENFGSPSPTTEQVYSGINMKSLKRNSPSRIVVPNVVYLMNLPQLSIIEEVLKSPRFLGQYGRIERIIVHKNCTAHVTFVTATAAQLCIQSLNNFYFDGSKISAKVGTTKYPQDVDMAKIAANNKSEPPPSICLDPVFPPPPIGTYKVHNESKYGNEIDILHPHSRFDYTVVNNLGSVPISYGNHRDKKMVEVLINPLKIFRDSDTTQDNVLKANGMVFGTGGIHHPIWTDHTPFKSQQQLSQLEPQTSFVPNIPKPLLHLTEIDTKLSPRASSSYTYHSSSPFIPTPPSPSSTFSSKSIIKSNPLEFVKEKKFPSPRGIDELEQHFEGLNTYRHQEQPKQQVMESRLFTTYLPSCSPSSSSSSSSQRNLTTNIHDMHSFSRNDIQIQRNAPF